MIWIMFCVKNSLIMTDSKKNLLLKS